MIISYFLYDNNWNLIVKRSLKLTILIFVLLTTWVLSGCKDVYAENQGKRFDDTRLVIHGSDTLLEVSMYWVEDFLNANPGINISVTGGGSGTGIAALINKTVDLASRYLERIGDQSVNIGDRVLYFPTGDYSVFHEDFSDKSS